MMPRETKLFCTECEMGSMRSRERLAVREVEIF